MRIFLFAVVSLASLAGTQPAMAEGDVDRGKVIYDKICLYCHRLDYDEKFGPGLAGVMERVDDEWMHSFLERPGEMLKNDEYAQTLKEGNRWNMTMPALPQMQDRQAREDVIEYMRTLE